MKEERGRERKEGRKEGEREGKIKKEEGETRWVKRGCHH